MDLKLILLVAGLISLVGLGGVLLRKNLVIMLMSLELMLLGGVLALLGAARCSTATTITPDGALLVPFVLIIAACEACIGLSLIMKIFKEHGTIWVDEIDKN